jgi:hypothetical protein
MPTPRRHFCPRSRASADSPRLRLKSGKNWFCFAKRVYSKHVSIFREALILWRPHARGIAKIVFLSMFEAKLHKPNFDGMQAIPSISAVGLEHDQKCINWKRVTWRSRK